MNEPACRHERAGLSAAAATAAGATPGDLTVRVAERNGLTPRQAGNIRCRLVLAGYLSQSADGTVNPTDLVPAHVIGREAPEEIDYYRSHDTHNPAKILAYPMSGSLCRNWMSCARAHCVLPANHSGRCRSRL